MEYSFSLFIGIIFTVFIIVGVSFIGLHINKNLEDIDKERSWNEKIKEIKDLVEYVYVQAEGSSKKYKANLQPEEILCFVNLNELNDPYLTEDDKRFLEFIKTTLSEEEPVPNTYYRKDAMKRYTHIPHLIPTHTICLKKGDSIAYLENKGTYVDITK
ncbi:MAG: hypothetical protein GXN99_00180 [Candidatus Nanohaloarchaeota archaeon]|nr:hypothetical protein [Candidatus Nanohaloarchaeota archaeon]